MTTEIGVDEVRIWRVPLVGHDKSNFYESLLSPDEIARADRFLTLELRERYVTCRAALRKLLAKEVGSCRPNEINFAYQQWGKPILAPSSNGGKSSRIHFNVSHSADLALIAVAQSDVGVDLEVPLARTNHRAIASQVLHPTEKEDLSRRPAREFAGDIMRLWVTKEAILKALGLGIAEGLQRISFPIPIPMEEAFSPRFIDPGLQEHLEDDGTCRMNSWIDTQTWRLTLLNLPGCYSAIATSRHIRSISTLEFDHAGPVS